MRRVKVMVLGLAWFGSLGGCVHGPGPLSGSHPEVLLALERTWADAVMSHDPTPIENLLADDFTQTSETGEVRTREETLARIAAGTAVFSSGGLEDVRVRFYGDAAVVTGRFRAGGRLADEAFTVDVRWTDTFVRREGQWLCVASHSSTVAGN